MAPSRTVDSAMVTIADEATKGGWSRTVSVQGRHRLGRRLWNEVRGARGPGCTRLALVARGLTAPEGRVDDTSAVSRAGQRLENVALAYPLLTPDPDENPAELAARALRIIGIQFCVAAGDLRHCVCLADLSEQVEIVRLEQVLAAGLSDWTERASPLPGRCGSLQTSTEQPCGKRQGFPCQIHEAATEPAGQRAQEPTAPAEAGTVESAPPAEVSAVESTPPAEVSAVRSTPPAEVSAVRSTPPTAVLRSNSELPGGVIGSGIRALATTRAKVVALMRFLRRRGTSRTRR